MKASSSSAIIKDFSFDTLRIKDTLAWWDHYEVAGPPDNPVTVWDGSDEVAATVTVWDGSDEVEATLEYTS